MLVLFKTSCEQNLVDLDELLHQENWSELVALAHKLRTSYHSLGINKGGVLLEAIEMEAKHGASVPSLQEYITQLNDLSKIALMEIDDLLLTIALEENE